MGDDADDDDDDDIDEDGSVWSESDIIAGLMAHDDMPPDCCSQCYESSEFSESDSEDVSINLLFVQHRP